MDEPLKPITSALLREAARTMEKYDALADPAYIEAIAERMEQLERERRDLAADSKQHLDKLWALVERWRAAKVGTGVVTGLTLSECAEDLAEALRAGSGYVPPEVKP